MSIQISQSELAKLRMMSASVVAAGLANNNPNKDSRACLDFNTPKEIATEAVAISDEIFRQVGITFVKEP